MIVILDVRKRRNNVVSILTTGICAGLRELHLEHQVIQYAEEHPSGKRVLDVSMFPADTETVIVPYWISRIFWDVNLSDIRRRFPTAKIIAYTGTSLYWHGSIPSYVPESRSIDCSGLNAIQRANYDAVDLFTVIRARDGVRPPVQRQVGMGAAPELGVGPKSPMPTIVVDTLKAGWDEAAYDDALPFVERAAAAIPGCQIILIDANERTKHLVAKRTAKLVSGNFVPFEQVVKLWTSAWAFVCHNESFGYPIFENTTCGTRVFCSGKADVPSWHLPVVARIEQLQEHVAKMNAMTGPERMEDARHWAEHYRAMEPDLFSWRDAVERMLA